MATLIFKIEVPDTKDQEVLTAVAAVNGWKSGDAQEYVSGLLAKYLSREFKRAKMAHIDTVVKAAQKTVDDATDVIKAEVAAISIEGK